MKKKARTGERLAVALASCFSVGVLLGWSLRGKPPSPASLSSPSSTSPVVSVLRQAQGVLPSLSRDGFSSTTPKDDGPAATTGEPLISAPPLAPVGAAIDELQHRDLDVPIEGATIESMKGGFVEARDGRQHEAVDILSPRNTPVHAVEDGTIAKLFLSKAGGNTIYQFDPSGRYCYYYAHLERYAHGLHDGQRVSRGEVIGYVGASGNAPPNTPHLHFTVFELTADRRWWQGRALDPYLIFHR